MSVEVLKVEKKINASPERLFRAWLNGRDFARWFLADDRLHLGEVRLDPRPGGKFRIDIDVKRLDHFGQQLDKSANRLTLGIVTGCLIIGSSIVMTVKAGPMLRTLEIPITPDDTAGTLHETLSQLGAQLLSEAVSALAQGHIPTPIPQDNALATLAPLLDKEHGRADFTRSAKLVCGHLRGVDPWPGGYTLLPPGLAGPDAVPLKLFLPKVSSGQGRPGEVLGVDRARVPARSIGPALREQVGDGGREQGARGGLVARLESDRAEPRRDPGPIGHLETARELRFGLVGRVVRQRLERVQQGVQSSHRAAAGGAQAREVQALQGARRGHRSGRGRARTARLDTEKPRAALVTGSERGFEIQPDIQHRRAVGQCARRD